MDDARYFEQRAKDYAAAARQTSDRWYAVRFAELATHFAALARQAPRRAADLEDRQSPA
jgi:hypothetical protein